MSLSPPPFSPSSSASSSSIRTTHKTSRGIYSALLQTIIKPFGNKLIQPGDPLPAGSRVLTPDSSVEKHCDVVHEAVESVNIYHITVKSSDEHQSTHIDGKSYEKETMRKEKQIYYFCGGGWQSPPSKEHWKLCAKLAEAGTKAGMRTRVSVVSYPLAPNSPASVTLPLLEKVYYALLSPPAATSSTTTTTTSSPTPTSMPASEASNTEMILAGDSSGANIALSLTLSILNANPSAPIPSALLLISPPCDLRNTNPDMSSIAPHDPVLTIPFVNSTARAWCNGTRDDTPSSPHTPVPYDDPRVSPVLADVAVLKARGVKVHGVVGGYDVLTPDALVFKGKLEREGLEGRWLVWEKMMHCFPLAGAGYGLPEGKEAVQWVEGVLFGE